MVLEYEVNGTCMVNLEMLKINGKSGPTKSLCQFIHFTVIILMNRQREFVSLDLPLIFNVYKLSIAVPVRAAILIN